VKRRTLIVDLDCPFGINHFDLVDCNECENSGILLDKAMNPMIPQGNSTIQWTTISGNSSSHGWGNAYDTDTFIFYDNGAGDSITSEPLKNFSIEFTTDVSTTTALPSNV